MILSIDGLINIHTMGMLSTAVKCVGSKNYFFLFFFGFDFWQLKGQSVCFVTGVSSVNCSISCVYK